MPHVAPCYRLVAPAAPPGALTAANPIRGKNEPLIRQAKDNDQPEIFRADLPGNSGAAPNPDPHGL